jgi:hypothetical protein
MGLDMGQKIVQRRIVLAENCLANNYPKKGKKLSGQEFPGKELSALLKFFG